MSKKLIPKTEIKKTDAQGKATLFEKCYSLSNDPDLQREGVSLCAITEKIGGSYKNQLIFKKNGQKSGVECIHTAVCSLQPLVSLTDEVVSADAIKGLKMALSIEDSFFALKSFADYLAQNGVENTIKIAKESLKQTGQEPLDMNYLMRSQITSAIEKISPDVGRRLRRLI